MTYEEKIDRLANTKDSVPIHDLYANSLFEFRFPMSETESYYLLQDCLVALYYQLYFLKQQCNWVRGDGFEWARCRYGNGVQCDDCTTWWCSEAMEKSKEFKQGNEYAKLKQDKCGSSGNKSPLQAFLTDCLPGFSCGEVVKKMKKYCKKPSGIAKEYSVCYPEFLEHRGHCPPGQYCPIPMGFRESFRKGTETGGQQQQQQTPVGMSGLAINAIAAHYANDDLRDSCLYQVTRCISSLTRRVPRSTGTLYGFFYGMISVYQSGSSTTGGTATDKEAFKKALDVELAKETFGLQGSVTLMTAVTKWKSSGHQKDKDGSKCECLDSLSGCEEGSKKPATESTCGKYLHPLTGSLYNSVATQYCDTYLSWILYLTGVLKAGLESLQKAFRDIDCSKSGCVKTEKGVITPGEKCECATKCIAPRDGSPGKHGETNQCKCYSVVHCAGVYGVFYRFGFSFVSPFSLSGRQQGQANSTSGPGKRTCYQFYTQLKNVIDGKLFSEVLDDIRRFLYTTRLPFTLVIFSFWSIVLGYLLWSMTYNLDLIHIQSHWRSPGSYLVPLQRILADGSRNVKRVCTIGYFQEGTGDRLLSEGISDVYL